MNVKVTTWNVNSIKARLERVVAWLSQNKPDIVCLQELKTVDETFPFAPLKEIGYEASVFGQKTYNGVAVLSRKKMDKVRKGIEDNVEDSQSRLISVQTHGITVISGYFPNGGEIGSDKYAYKLQWMERLLALLKKQYKPKDKILLCGDTNIALDEADIADPEKWADTVLCYPDGRQRLKDIIDWGFTDVFRVKNPEGGLYTWWDYRQLAFPKNDGLRIDHILATKSLTDKLVSAEIDRKERKGTKPSDHAPVSAVFDI